MLQSRPLRLVLFFTRGVSLDVWHQVGMFEREAALYRRLQDGGVKVSFVTYGGAGELRYQERLPGIKILCNRWQWAPDKYERWLPFLHGPWLWRSHVIKTNQTYGADVALRAARRWGKPLIARCGYMWSEFIARAEGDESPSAKYARQVEAAIFSAAHQVVVTTLAMAADITARVPAAADRIRVIPNYVDTATFRPLGVEPDFDLLFVGRLAPQKNLAALLEAIRPLSIRLTVIGRGESGDPLRQEFGDMEGRVRWMGNIPNTELPSYLNRARLFVLPSFYEGHPKAMIEAMACGRPVIGANVTGIREVISHGKSGWLCGTDAVSIRNAIQELLGQPELRAGLGQKARSFVLEHLTLERVAEMELDLLRTLVR